MIKHFLNLDILNCHKATVRTLEISYRAIVKYLLKQKLCKYESFHCQLVWLVVNISLQFSLQSLVVKLKAQKSPYRKYCRPTDLTPYLSGKESEARQWKLSYSYLM